MYLYLDYQREVTVRAVPSKQKFMRWVRAVLEGRRERTVLTIRIVDEAESAALNQTFRGFANPTNVLSFPFESPPSIKLDNFTKNLIGDLVLCAPLVRREAEEQGKQVSAHWAHLTIHGVLHLLGYDHQIEAETAIMEKLETQILGTLNFPPPYLTD